MAPMFLSIPASVTRYALDTKNFSQLSAKSDSVGHICWIGDREYYYQLGHVMSAHRTDVIDCTTGNRQGRSVTTAKSVAQYPSVYAYLGKSFIGLCEWRQEDCLGV